MVHRSTRQETIEVFQQVLQDVKIGGITTNLTFLESIIISECTSILIKLDVRVAMLTTLKPSTVEIL